MHPLSLVILVAGTLLAYTSGIPTEAGTPLSAQVGPRDADAWFEAEDDPIEQTRSVSDGELEFLPEPPMRPVHHHSNQLTIGTRSLDDGWVGMQQCHTGLDPVAQAQILFRTDRLRGLQITSSRNIGRHWIEGASVQLEDVRRGASLCLRAETRALHDLGNGLFELRNGPFMRRFLDGYYPMRLSLDIRYPAEFQPVDYSPPDQPGYRPRVESQRIVLDSWFEGRLFTRFRFVRRD